MLVCGEDEAVEVSSFVDVSVCIKGCCVIVEIGSLRLGSFVGGAFVPVVVSVARLGLGVGIFVETVTGRAVGVNADTGIGAFVPFVLCSEVTSGGNVIVVVGRAVIVIVDAADVVVVS